MGDGTLPGPYTGYQNFNTRIRWMLENISIAVGVDLGPDGPFPDPDPDPVITLRTLEFSSQRRVPTNGSVWARLGGVSLAQCPVRASADLIRTVSIAVNTSDVNPYDFEVYDGATLLGTIPLVAGQTTASLDLNATPSTSTPDLKVKVVRVSGSGASAFERQTITANLQTLSVTPLNVMQFSLNRKLSSLITYSRRVETATIITGSGTIKRIDVRVSEADASRAWRAEVLVNGVQVETVDLVVGATSASAVLDSDFASGATILVRWRRVTGSGESTFDAHTITLDIGE